MNTYHTLYNITQIVIVKNTISHLPSMTGLDA